MKGLWERYAGKFDALSLRVVHTRIPYQFITVLPHLASILVLAGFVRVVTHPRVFSPPSPTAHALEFAEALRDHPNCVHIAPGERHWNIFIDLCRDAGVKGNLVPDAYLAALAIESGSEWMTSDRDYSRFPGLRWRDPGA